MFERAFAKINLSLDINGIRDDGYHTLKSIFLPINFYDELNIIKNDVMEFVCNKKYIRFDENNTIYKTIELIKSKYDIHDNFKITLNKQIPTQAGLGGGSTDAAATLKLLNKMYSLNLNDDEIKELCTKIGSDVLFTYYNKPAFVSGIGENIEFIDVKDKYYVLIIKPHFGISTRECYRLMDLNNCIHPDIDSLKNALINGEDIIPYLGNSMEKTAISLLNDIEKAEELLKDNNAPFVLMSGSGSSVFTMSKDKELINNIYEKVKNKGYYTRITNLLL